MMKKAKKLQPASMETPGLRSGIFPKVPWAQLLFAALMVYSVSCGLRIAQYDQWRTPALEINGEYIMGTHDAYHWMAGAVGIGRAVGEPMSVLAATFSKVLNIPVGLFCFWAPVFLSGLVGIVTVLWGWTLGSIRAGAFAGLLAALQPGFYGRTMLTYYDTDLVTLFFPLLISWGMAHWIRPHLQERILSEPITAVLLKKSPRLLSKIIAFIRGEPRGDHSTSPFSTHVSKTHFGVFFLWAVCFGALANAADAWHPRLHEFNIALFILTMLLVLALSFKESKSKLLVGLVCFALPAFHGLLGAVVALVLGGALSASPRLCNILFRSVWPALVGLILLGVTAINPVEYFDTILFYLDRYLSPVSDAIAASEAVSSLPVLSPSVSEEFELSIDYLEFFHLWWWPAVVGGIGFLGLVFFRPVSIILAPMMILAFFGFKLGARMGMFGAPGVGLGVAFFTYWFLNRLFFSKPWGNKAVTAGMFLCTAILIYPCAKAFPKIPPTPTISKPQALALEHIQAHSPEDSRVWMWWDWGYATRYYARRSPIADGGFERNMQRILPLSMVYATDSPVQARNLMQVTEQHSYVPGLNWAKQDPQKVMAYLTHLRKTKQRIPFRSKQYLVVSFESFQFGYWMTFFGSWDFRSHRGTPSKMMALYPPLSLNTQQGAIRLESPTRYLKCRSLDILTQDGRAHFDYPHNHNAPHVVINKLSGEGFAFDEKMYNSMAVQLLISDPKQPEISKNFALTYEGRPFVRVYVAK